MSERTESKAGSGVDQEGSTARTEAPASSPRIVFFGMEVTIEEATDLLSRASIICSLIPAAGGQNANWGMVLQMATEFQRDLVKMHSEPGRVLIRCAACGGSLGDSPTTPYLRVPNPVPNHDAAPVTRTVGEVVGPEVDGGTTPPASTQAQETVQ